MRVALALLLVFFMTACDDDEFERHLDKSLLHLRLTECRLLMQGVEPLSLNDEVYIPNKLYDLEERAMVRRECRRGF